jgi:hypothetical protein
VQRRILGQKSDEVTGEWVELHNEDSNYQVKENEMGRACNTNGEKRNIYIENIGGKAKRKKTVSRLSRQCGIPNLSQPYRPPRPVTGIALLFTYVSLMHELCKKMGRYLQVNLLEMPRLVRIEFIRPRSQNG